MIDISAENILTLTEAAKKLPKRRKGSRPHVATMYRWVQRGVKGVKLESIQVGGTLCTSLEALQHFFNALSKPRAPQPRTDRRREREIEAAEAECQKRGI